MMRGLEERDAAADLPNDLPSFLERFGTDQRCRAYLFEARSPAGLAAARPPPGAGAQGAPDRRCPACGEASLLAGTIFEQPDLSSGRRSRTGGTGLARWFLAIFLVTSSKGGDSAMELKRQMGFGSYQTAWSWLHKIRKAMVRPDRPPLSARVEADETYLGGPRPGKPGRGAKGKIKVAGAVESGRGQGRGRRLGRLRLGVVPDVSANSLEGFLGRSVAPPATVATDGWPG